MGHVHVHVTSFCLQVTAFAPHILLQLGNDALVGSNDYLVTFVDHSVLSVTQ